MEPERQTFDLKQLSRQIDQQRLERNLTWAQVSRDVGVATSTIQRFATVADAEADGVLQLIGWLCVAPEPFISNSTAVGADLSPAGDGVIRVDMALVADLRGWPKQAKRGARTTIQRLASAAQASERTIASLTRWSAS